MRNISAARVGLAFAMVATSLQGGARAQDLSSQPGIQALDLQAICMEKLPSNVPQLQNSASSDRPFRVLAVRKSTASLRLKGFSEVDCLLASLSTSQQQTAYRDAVCDLASNGNEAVQSQYERALGERPAVLCANAQLATGTKYQEAR